MLSRAVPFGEVEVRGLMMMAVLDDVVLFDRRLLKLT